MIDVSGWANVRRLAMIILRLLFDEDDLQWATVVEQMRLLVDEDNLQWATMVGCFATREGEVGFAVTMEAHSGFSQFHHYEAQLMRLL
jgi:hypothetical protein